MYPAMGVAFYRTWDIGVRVRDGVVIGNKLRYGGPKPPPLPLNYETSAQLLQHKIMTWKR